MVILPEESYSVAKFCFKVVVVSATTVVDVVWDGSSVNGTDVVASAIGFSVLLSFSTHGGRVPQLVPSQLQFSPIHPGVELAPLLF